MTFYTLDFFTLRIVFIYVQTYGKKTVSCAQELNSGLYGPSLYAMVEMTVGITKWVTMRRLVVSNDIDFLHRYQSLLVQVYLLIPSFQSIPNDMYNPDFESSFG